MLIENAEKLNDPTYLQSIILVELEDTLWEAKQIDLKIRHPNTVEKTERLCRVYTTVKWSTKLTIQKKINAINDIIYRGILDLCEQIANNTEFYDEIYVEYNNGLKVQYETNTFTDQDFLDIDIDIERKIYD
jgi:hypothetical protein